MPRSIPLSDYTPKMMRKAQVFKLDALPKSTPIDVNLSALIQESGWNQSDRLRFWHAYAGLDQIRLTIRKMDLDEKALVQCNVDAGGAVSISCNNREYATRFFRSVFLNVPPTFTGARNWRVTSGWTTDRVTVALFAGSVAGALGWGPKVPQEIEASLKEALENLTLRNWKSCVVMCRRALQALMEVAYEKQFSTKPGKLDLNAIADSVRNLGNVPGAHPRAIHRYRFSKQDAELAYTNTASFVAAYFEKIASPTI